MNKISPLILSQLPSFVSGDENYQTFVAFLEAYYEWMEQKKNVTFESSKLLEYSDIDTTLDEYVQYFYDVFMPAFPVDVLADKRKLIRFSKELYESKGNEASYKFLFRVLYNSDPEIIETKEYVLKPSSGKWFLPRSIKIKSNDSRWVNTEGLWVFGNTSKSLAKIERAKIVNNRIELFLSDIERLFQTGENVKIVNRNLQDVYFDPYGKIVTSGGEILEAKLLGSISNVILNPNYRGNYYLAGDPVAVYSGMEDESIGIGATAEIGEVTLGSIQRVRVEDGSWGYREDPNTIIYVTPDSGRPILTVSSINPANSINVSIVTDSLLLKNNIVLNCNTMTGIPVPGSNSYCFAKTNANSVISNANTVMADAFSYKTFSTYSIETVTVQNGGGGFRSVPTLQAESVYETDLPLSMGDPYDPRYYGNRSNNITSLKSLGILAPILFRSNTAGYKLRGEAYEVGDEIIFSGGLGGGAYANITSVVGGGSFGPINTVSYYTTSEYPAPLGGFGYSTKELPLILVKPKTKTANTVNNSNILTIVSSNPLNNVSVGQIVTGNGIPNWTKITQILTSNTVLLSNNATGTYNSNTYQLSGYGAELYVSTVLGDSAKLVPITDRIGSITTIKVTNYGEDYTSQPNVSLKVQDIAVVGLELSSLPKKGDVVYQGESLENATYKSFVFDLSRITFDEDPTISTYILRVYNYTKLPNAEEPLIIQKFNIPSPNTFPVAVKTDYIFPAKILPDGSSVSLGQNGILTYGDGSARANTQFLQGLILGQGRYIDESHQPSSYSLLQDEDHNNFTYVVSVEKEISKYKEMLYRILHPAGTKVSGQTVLKSENKSELEIKDSTYITKFEDFEMIWAALSTEESSDNAYESQLMRFPEPQLRYGIVSSNNSSLVRISNFPTSVVSGKLIFGNGIPSGTIIKEVYLGNNTIRLSNSSILTTANSEFLIQDIWTGNMENYSPLSSRFFGATSNNSNLLSVITTSNTIQDLVKNQIVYSNTISIYANTVNSSNILQNVQSTTNIVIGQYVSGLGIPNGTRVSNIVGNDIYLTNVATSNNNGIHYNYYNKDSGNYLDVYKYNYAQFSGLPYNAKIKQIISSNNSIVLSTNFIKSNFDDVFYFIGDGAVRDTDNPSEFIRIESGTFSEKTGKENTTPKKERYYSYNDLVNAFDETETLDQLVTESGEPLIATIYIKT